jgi:hypothetical protein
MLTGNWQNNVEKKEYLKLFKQKNAINHIRSSSDVEKLNQKAAQKLSDN